MRHDYAVLRDDKSLARYVTFTGSPFQAQKNFEGAQYIQDAWSIRDGLLIEAGLRAEWNEIVRDLEVAPRVAVAWAPSGCADTKFSAGWGVYYDSISLDLISRAAGAGQSCDVLLAGGSAARARRDVVHGQRSRFACPVLADGELQRRTQAAGRILSAFRGHAAHRAIAASLLCRRRLRRVRCPQDGAVYRLGQCAARPRYDAFEVSLRHTFAGRYEWFAGYTRSSSRSNAMVDYSLENPIFAPQGEGPFAWDTPNRFHMWGWAPLPNRVLPAVSSLPDPANHGGVPAGISHWISVRRGERGGLSGGQPELAPVPRLLQHQLTPRAAVPCDALPLGLAVRI